MWLRAKSCMWRAGDVLNWIAAGKLKLRIDRAYPLAEAAAAHRDLEGRRTAGKLLLTVPGGMNLQAKLTLGAVLLETLIVGAISAVDLGNAMQIEFEAALKRADMVRLVASDYVAQSLNSHTSANLSDREKLTRSGSIAAAEEGDDGIR